MQGKFNFSQKHIYIKYILHKELGSDKENLIHKLREHQYWNKVSFIDLDDTLRIMKRNFSIEDICSNIHIILYPWYLSNVDQFSRIDNVFVLLKKWLGRI